jgi:hypothetical protein
MHGSRTGYVKILNVIILEKAGNRYYLLSAVSKYYVPYQFDGRIGLSAA